MSLCTFRAAQRSTLTLSKASTSRWDVNSSCADRRLTSRRRRLASITICIRGSMAAANSRSHSLSFLAESFLPRTSGRWEFLSHGRYHPGNVVLADPALALRDVSVMEAAHRVRETMSEHIVSDYY